MEEDKIVYGNCWVAYFDMLGFSNRIKSQLPLESTLNIYDEIIGKIKNINRYCEDIKIAWFSDTFLFYAKDDLRNSFINLRNFTTDFSRRMFLEKIPMRGCMHCGNFYAEEERRIYFGEGLIVAYEQAEDQQMIGFTMTQEAKVKLTEYPTDNPEKLNENVWEHCEKYEWLEYDIPFKKNANRRLPIYNLSIMGMKTDTAQLWKALTSMKSIAKTLFKEELKEQKKIPNFLGINNCLVYKGIMKKYKNTYNLLSAIYPK